MAPISALQGDVGVRCRQIHDRSGVVVLPHLAARLLQGHAGTEHQEELGSPGHDLRHRTGAQHRRRLGDRVSHAPRLDGDARPQDRHVHLRAARPSHPRRDARGRLAGGAAHRSGCVGASGLVGEPVHHHLGLLRQEGRRHHRRAGRHGRIGGRHSLPLVLRPPARPLSRQCHRRVRDPVRHLRVGVRRGLRHPSFAGAEARADQDDMIHENFLLETDLARELYHEWVKDLPIIDYHYHLPVQQIASNHVFRSMTEIWLNGDHYKWRAMRANGVDERFCTGDASDWEKFEAWARTVPATLRNPLYHWTHLELKNPFGVTELLSEKTARAIFDRCNEQLANLSTENLLRHFRVAVVCTTDDPADSLEHHHALACRTGPQPVGGSEGAAVPEADGLRTRPTFVPDTRVVPTWRPDAALNVEDPVAFNRWIDRLEAAAGMSITKIKDFYEALDRRHAAFHDAGCRASDHGLEQIYAKTWAHAEIGQIGRASCREGGTVG